MRFALFCLIAHEDLGNPAEPWPDALLWLTYTYGNLRVIAHDLRADQLDRS